MKPVTETNFVSVKILFSDRKNCSSSEQNFQKKWNYKCLIYKKKKEYELNYKLNTTHFSEQHIKFYVTMLNTPAYVCQHLV